MEVEVEDSTTWPARLWADYSTNHSAISCDLKCYRSPLTVHRPKLLLKSFFEFQDLGLYFESMHVDDQRWIMNDLGIELPNSYLIETNNFPFLDHLDSDTLVLWDSAQSIITATKKFRVSRGWTDHWVCIGMSGKRVYALNCTSEEVILVEDAYLDKIIEQISTRGSVKRIIDEIHDGYRGLLPSMMPRKDSSFKYVNIYTEIPWESTHGKTYPYPFLGESIFRIRQESANVLAERLKSLDFHVMEIDGSKMQNEDLFFDELAIKLNYEIGDMHDFSNALINYLKPISDGGLLQVAVLWHNSDQVLKALPNRFVDVVAFFAELDIFLDSGAYVNVFYLGSSENGYKEGVL